MLEYSESSANNLGEQQSGLCKTIVKRVNCADGKPTLVFEGRPHQTILHIVLHTIGSAPSEPLVFFMLPHGGLSSRPFLAMKPSAFERREAHADSLT